MKNNNMNATTAEPPIAEVNAAEQDLPVLGITVQAFLAEALDGAEDANKVEEEDGEAVFIAKFILWNDIFIEALQDPRKPPSQKAS